MIIWLGSGLHESTVNSSQPEKWCASENNVKEKEQTFLTIKSHHSLRQLKNRRLSQTNLLFSRKALDLSLYIAQNLAT